MPHSMQAGFGVDCVYAQWPVDKPPSSLDHSMFEQKEELDAVVVGVSRQIYQTYLTQGFFTKSK